MHALAVPEWRQGGTRTDLTCGVHTPEGQCLCGLIIGWEEDLLEGGGHLRVNVKIELQRLEGTKSRRSQRGWAAAAAFF
jgi:hypothetical protein